MRFESLLITNLRAISRFQIDALGGFVVIAGQNGSGKSCVFDAIRLLKSLYGGYQANEYQQWFGEFAVNLQDPKSIQKLFRNPSQPICIEAIVSFAESEREFIRNNSLRLAQPLAWAQATGQTIDYYTYNQAAVFTQMRTRQAELTALAKVLSDEILAGLKQERHRLRIEINPDGSLAMEDSKAVEAAFQAYEPRHLGIIEYHSASRSYSRQQVGGINLDVRAFEDQQRQSRLYNWQSKYQNIKTELAASYVRSMIARDSGVDIQSSAFTLDDTLKELFTIFFPDKTYEGVVPRQDGVLEYPVRLSTGEVHDIDEMSSGEKEILYGYLKLKNSTPAHSVILLDEPELHLNPSLLHGFADFYYRRLGVEQDNQLWLVTHSDTLLRQAVGNANYGVFQMMAAAALDAGGNQAVEVLADDDVERVTIQLLGDLAAYRPHGKVVILEGAGEDGLDVTMVRRLFPEFARRVNLVSGGNKHRVGELSAALGRAAETAGLRNRFFAVVDKDRGVSDLDPNGATFAWDVYHIENFLLEPAALRGAARTVVRQDPFSSDESVLMELERSAREIIDVLVLERLQAEVNNELIEAISIGGGRRPPFYLELFESLQNSVDRISRIASERTPDALGDRTREIRAELEAALANGSWRSEFPGRLILRRFCDRVFSHKVPAALYLNATLEKMVDLGIKPEGMKRVLDQIQSR